MMGTFNHSKNKDDKQKPHTGESLIPTGMGTIFNENVCWETVLFILLKTLLCFGYLPKKHLRGLQTFRVLQSIPCDDPEFQDLPVSM